MIRGIAVVLTGLLLPVLLSTLAVAGSSRSDDVARIQRSTEVFQEIMGTPEHAIPQKLLDSAQCIAIIPGEKQLAFGFGGKHGKGLVTCRTAKDWSAPAFLSVSGGSYGFQIGASSTDIVMVFKNKNGLKDLLSHNFKLGVGATAAAGPVGRDASASTDLEMHAEILTYARSRGAFAGISLNGAVVKPDESGDAAMYGPNVTTKQIVSGSVAVPSAAQPLISELKRQTGKERAKLQ
ncbi:MAG: lipid-binding SYLF domain-containing protein [Terriglobia bacterium]